MPDRMVNRGDSRSLMGKQAHHLTCKSTAQHPRARSLRSWCCIWRYTRRGRHRFARWPEGAARSRRATP